MIIGNATAAVDKDDFPYLRARWEVEIVPMREDAPQFGHFIEKTNTFGRSYEGWKGFFRRVALYDYFYDPEFGKCHEHPGCVGLTVGDVMVLKDTYEAFKRSAYGKEDNIDFQVLTWLMYWVTWAVEHCETPAIQNW